MSGQGPFGSARDGLAPLPAVPPARSCKWIEASDAVAAIRRGEGENVYCGAPAVAGTSWCVKHSKRVHLRGAPG